MTPRVIIDSRYELGDLLGVGGSGRVWRAVDRVTGATVAFKLIGVDAERHRVRVRREVQALRALNLAGVVKLLEVGEHLGEPYLVTEFIDGTPFPGRNVERTWAGIFSRTLALAQTLAQVHAAGFVHRDLKPENILVTDEGRVTLLDFGLVRELQRGGTVTVHAAGPVGTPRYLSPEQLLGHRVDARSDLYALGVMLFEVLTGHPPLPDEGIWSRRARRQVPAAPRLGVVLPGVESGVAALVDRLLAVNPEDRPRGGQQLLAALQALERQESRLLPVTLPFVGREAELAWIVEQAGAGASVDVSGPSGSGRSRLLREAAARLTAQGREVSWLTPGRAPFSALTGLLGNPSGPDPLVELSAALRERLARGLVVVVDDAAGLDRFSRQVLAASRSAGTILQVADTPEALALAPLSAEALRGLFHGPDRVLHLPEDAAEELHTRTGGLAGRVDAELRAWVEARLCDWEDGRLRIRRGELDQLRGGLLVGLGAGWSYAEPHLVDEASGELLAWLVLAAGALDVDTLIRASGGKAWEVRVLVEDLVLRGLVRQRRDGCLDALVVPPQLQSLDEEEVQRRHREIALVLPARTEARLRQWMQVGDVDVIAAEALEAARVLRIQGAAAAAFGLLLSVAPLVRARVAPEAEATLLEEATLDALETRQREHILAVRSWLVAAGSPEAPRLVALVDTVHQAAWGEPALARAEAERIGRFENPDLEIARLGVIVRIAVESRSADAPRLLEDLADHADPRMRARHRTWLGLLAYEHERFAEAADLHAEAARLDPGPRRLVALLNEASAALEGGQPERALHAALRLGEEGRRLRHVSSELWAETLRRAARYRMGQDEPPDEAWLDLSRSLGEARRHAYAALVEAAGAWRCGQDVRAGEIAAEAADTFRSAGQPGLAALPQALAARCGRGDCEAAWRAALGSDRPRIRLQALVLLAPRRSTSETERRIIRELNALYKGNTTPGRLDVLAFPDETS